LSYLQIRFLRIVLGRSRPGRAVSSLTVALRLEGASLYTLGSLLCYQYVAATGCGQLRFGRPLGLLVGSLAMNISLFLL